MQESPWWHNGECTCLLTHQSRLSPKKQKECPQSVQLNPTPWKWKGWKERLCGSDWSESLVTLRCNKCESLILHTLLMTVSADESDFCAVKNLRCNLLLL